MRAARVDDAEAIERIRIDTWRATYRGLLPDVLLDRLAPDVEARRERLGAPGQQLCVVGEDGGAVVGYALAGAERTNDPEYRGEVYAIYVLPSHQGRGLGRELIRECVTQLAARGLTSLLIWVLRENASGRGFYERLGGTPVREKPLEEFAGAESYVEIGYGWTDATKLTR